MIGLGSNEYCAPYCRVQRTSVESINKPDQEADIRWRESMQNYIEKVCLVCLCQHLERESFSFSRTAVCTLAHCNVELLLLFELRCNASRCPSSSVTEFIRLLLGVPVHMSMDASEASFSILCVANPFKVVLFTKRLVLPCGNLRTVHSRAVKHAILTPACVCPGECWRNP